MDMTVKELISRLEKVDPKQKSNSTSCDKSYLLNQLSHVLKCMGEGFKYNIVFIGG